jgi:O-antigen/teichoic acid export membrane protein
MIQSATLNKTGPEAQTSDVAAAAGRGAVYITLAKLWFIVSGYGIAVTLTYLLSAEEYGLYRVVINAVSIVNAVIVTGTYQTVSKYVSQEPEKADSVKAKALALQVRVGGAIAAGFFLLAPVVAYFLNDSRLTNYLRLASLITLAYAFYSVYTGYFNGQKRFLLQAGVDASYSTLKAGLIVLLVWLGLGVSGGVGGFALAAACVLALAATLGRGGARRGEVKSAELFRFQSYLLVFTFVLTLLQKIDLMLVKALSSPDAAAASANAGYYGAAIDLANISYQIIISVTFVIFPLVSRSTFEDDRSRTQSYVSGTLRYSLMIMALTATLFSANAGEVLRVVYPQAYQAGSHAFGIVAYGMLFFGLLYVLTTIISASGRPAVSLLIGVVTLGISAAACAVLIPAYGLAGAAVGTTAAMLAGAAAASAYVRIKFGRLLPFWSFARIAACAGAIYAMSRAFAPGSRIMILVQLAGLSISYLALLFLTGEIKRKDLNLLARVVGR